MRQNSRILVEIENIFSVEEDLYKSSRESHTPPSTVANMVEMASNAGLLAWATTLRVSMINDPCRQMLSDAFQTHGFRWLDEHLENVLAGPERE